MGVQQIDKAMPYAVQLLLLFKDNMIAEQMVRIYASLVGSSARFVQIVADERPRSARWAHAQGSASPAAALLKSRRDFAYCAGGRYSMV